MTHGRREFSVLTHNTYFGADLRPVIAATSPQEVIAAVTEAWSHVQASKIPERALKIAQAIARVQPDLVGLQEIVQLFHGPFDRMTLEYDFLDLILEALRAHGVAYSIVAIQNDFDQPIPASADGIFFRFVDRHAVLVRTTPASSIQPLRIHSGTFQNLHPLGESGLLAVPRSWIAVDAKVGAAEFRFIESHIESYEAGVQLAQAGELIAGPANIERPVVMVGDFNSNGNQDPAVLDCTPTYPALIGAGFRDSWAVVNPGDLGNTGVQAADLRNPESTLDRRIDLILVRGEAVSVSATLVNATPDARTASGLWPSDHAGVLATLAIR